VTFIDQELKDGSTLKAGWDANTGYIKADDGTKIAASQAKSGLQVSVTSADGKTTTQVDPSALGGHRGERKHSGLPRHNVRQWAGLDKQRSVGKLIKGDGYSMTSNPQVGDARKRSRPAAFGSSNLASIEDRRSRLRMLHPRLPWTFPTAHLLTYPVQLKKEQKVVVRACPTASEMGTCVGPFLPDSASFSTIFLNHAEAALIARSRIPIPSHSRVTACCRASDSPPATSLQSTKPGVTPRGGWIPAARMRQ
jgi:hypothetical protein